MSLMLNHSRASVGPNKISNCTGCNLPMQTFSRGLFKRSDHAPPVPEKDQHLMSPPMPYASSSFSMSSTSISASSTAQSISHSMKSRSHASSPSQNSGSTSGGASKSWRKAIAKLPSLTKRPSFASVSSHVSQSEDDPNDQGGDSSISAPWNISVCIRSCCCPLLY